MNGVDVHLREPQNISQLSKPRKFVLVPHNLHCSRKKMVSKDSKDVAHAGETRKIISEANSLSLFD